MKPSTMHKVLIFTENAFNLSETFIFNQIKNDKIKPIIVSYASENYETFNHQNYKSYIVNSIPINIIDRILSLFIRLLYRNSSYSFPYSTLKIISKIIETEKIDIIHCNYGNNAIKFLPIISDKTPLICHFHGYDTSQLLKNKTYKKLITKIINKAKATITVSEDMTNRMLKNRLLNNNNVLINYGVNLENINIKTANYNKVQNLSILHVGRLTEKKGVLDLVKAFNDVTKICNDKKLTLNIVGDGEQMKQLKELVKEFSLEASVIIHGALSHKLVFKMMVAADIFILNSRTAANGDKEGFPNVIVESMASRCAVISTYHAGIPDAIDNNKNGLLVHERNNKELAKALQLIVENDSFRMDLQNNAYDKAINEFSIEKMYKKLNELYDHVI